MFIRILCVILIIGLILSAVGCTENAYASEKNNDIINGNREFAFEILKNLNLADSKENIFISPYSISAALSMLYNGAAGETKNALAQTLKYTEMTDLAFNNGHKYLKERLEDLDKKVDIDISNSIWIREGEKIKEDFIQKDIEVFDAYIESLDFSKTSAADTINKWIKESTKGLIDKMLTPPISPDIVMYLINTIYFKGEWTKSFDSDKTEKMLFQNQNTPDSEVDMMFMEDNIEYSKKDDYRAIRLPYGNEASSMYCILPEGDEDINTLIEKMTDDKWAEIRNSLVLEKKLPVMLPKFKMEYGIRNLNEELKVMGMEICFSNKADFSGIRDGIAISRVLHKAVIELDEKGTEAAAATVVEILETSMPVGDIPEFIADRPFLFIICDDTDGTILFIGKASDL